MQAGVQSYFAVLQAQDVIAQKQAGIITNPYMSIGTFGTGLSTQYRFGLALSTKPKGVIMDIDRILKQTVDKDNIRAKVTAYNRATGPSMSLNENLIPEQLFDDPNTKEKEAQGISAVKALQIASSQGQTIYTVTKANYAEILPKLNHSTDVMTDVRNAINAGKEVTISQTQVHAFGWSGTGYIVLDPESGVGAYLIGGGANGGYAEIKDSKGNSFSLIAFMPSLNLFNSTLMELNPYYKNISERLDILVRQVNKFYECNKEAILSLGVAIAISIAIALAIKTEVISLGTATPVVVPIIATLTTMYLATASATGKDNHCFTNRGRIQAQGEKLEESMAWNTNEPITAEQGLTMLEALKSKLSKKDLKI